MVSVSRLETYRRSKDIVLVFESDRFFVLFMSEHGVKVDRVHVDGSNQRLEHRLVPIIIALSSDNPHKAYLSATGYQLDGRIHKS